MAERRTGRPAGVQTIHRGVLLRHLPRCGVFLKSTGQPQQQQIQNDTWQGEDEKGNHADQAHSQAAFTQDIWGCFHNPLFKRWR